MLHTLCPVLSAWKGSGGEQCKGRGFLFSSNSTFMHTNCIHTQVYFTHTDWVGIAARIVTACLTDAVYETISFLFVFEFGLKLSGCSWSRCCTAEHVCSGLYMWRQHQLGRSTL